MRKLENYGVYYSSIWKDPQTRGMMIVELVICSLLMPPFINIEVPLALNGIEVIYTLDMMVSSLILLKSYLLLRVYEHVSKWTNYEAKKTTLPYGLETDYHFAFKSDVRSNNLIVFLLVGLVFVMYISTLIFNFESNYVEPRLEGKWEEFFN